MESSYAEHYIMSTFREMPAEGRESMYLIARTLREKYVDENQNTSDQLPTDDEILFPNAAPAKVADEDRTEDPEDGKMPKLSRKDLDDFLYCISSCLLDNVWTIEEALVNGGQVADRNVCAPLTLVTHSLRFLAGEINTQVAEYNRLNEDDLFTIAP